MSWYITLRADPTYSQSVPTQRITDFLLQYPNVAQTSPVDFTFQDTNYIISIILALSDVAGNYNTNKQFIPEINVVELVVPYTAPPAPYESLAVALATHLGWNAFEDNEDRQIWPLQ